jgi:hypothetical protein
MILSGLLTPAGLFRISIQGAFGCCRLILQPDGVLGVDVRIDDGADMALRATISILLFGVSVCCAAFNTQRQRSSAGMRLVQRDAIVKRATVTLSARWAK